MADDNLVTLRGLKKHYPITGGLFNRVVDHVKAVDGVDLSIRRGETLGLVGESGCGKSTLGRLTLRLEEATAGQVVFDGEELLRCSRRRLRELRRHMQVIFQDPFASLNFRRTVRQTVEEPLIVHRMAATRVERERRVRELMEEVGLQPEQIDSYPHEFSGGQAQRIGIARALAMHPKLIVCDEPVSALDVSIQAQVINLLQELQRRHRLTYLMISHNLAVIRHISNRVAVMYLGRIVELAGRDAIYAQPRHPYTQALVSASPIPDPDVRRPRLLLEGDVPSPIAPPPGCHFHPRCPSASERCARETPELREVEPGHAVRCHLHPGR